ncbi:oxidoreductase [Streptomyces pharetrae CZA14]|uniref:Oxidoreductase n=1 Tax=Streptomyces pharetrae CZA14 TaxID=1144883 RepID=A0ABX3YKQ0_9ACTN|nr:oxidoreductase [Streptomyces pharetrae CZA14]
MRVGIIGAGGIGRVHAEAVRAGTGVSLSGVYDVDRDRACALAGALRTRAFGSPHELYEASTGVIIAAPNRTHAGYAREALENGRSLLCEKPMAVSLAEAADMRTRAAASAAVCAMGFNYRYLGVVQEARRRITDGTLGRVLHADIAFTRPSALTRKHVTWRDGEAERCSSGALGDLGVHLIDLLHFLFDSSIDLTRCRVGLQTKVPRKGGVEVKVDDHAFVSGLLEDGPSFTLTASKATRPEHTGFTLALTGSRGDLVHHSQDGPVLHARTGVDWEPVKVLGPGRLADPAGEVPGWADSFVDQLHAWAGAVTGSRPPASVADFDTGYRAQRVLEELLRGGGRV